MREHPPKVLTPLVDWLEKRYPFHLNILFSSPSVRPIMKVGAKFDGYFFFDLLIFFF